ncbi:hypothetical protein MB901379_00595 [Mycobacterium basiliense]|uniref:Transposase DDE domain-containing protein n=1 Tax=Mycobacterium basiliense TaxID=2094119 RepID=A0A447G9H2_9MYCO|nr:hypothetical protein MB901379_00595 [Mycobacterium basiliense]
MTVLQEELDFCRVQSFQLKVSIDGHGVGSHAGMAMVRELANRTGCRRRSPPRLVDERIAAAHLPGPLAAPTAGQWLHIDIGANLVIDHSDNKELAAPTRKKPTDTTRCRRFGPPPRSRALKRCDTARATHDFATACRTAGVGYSFGYPADWRVQDPVDTPPTSAMAGTR